ncbi:MAG: ATP-binding protein [Fusobacteriaceae bacterium]
MKKRDSYLNELLLFKDKKIIKVITGMRRCGKSSLLLLLKENLLKNGVKEQNIISINFESMDYDSITDYKILNSFIKDKIDKSSKTYFLLDEIQLVKNWEKTINSIMVDFDVDIYITGSNAYLLSSELSTLLAGRFIEIKMLPLSFQEFLYFNDIKKNSDYQKYFDIFLKYGGLPQLSDFEDKENVKFSLLEGIYNTVIMKDVVQRNSVKDTSLLTNVFRFIAHNIGNIISPKKVSDVINSEGRKTTSETIDNYLLMLKNAFIIYQVQRYDIKGKQYLKTLGKYYLVDLGIRNSILGYRDVDYGHILENVVYLELIRRKYKVAIGKIGEYEIDFIAENQNEKKYYQVAFSINTQEVKEREIRPLLLIKDNYEKIIISSDKTFIKEEKGVKFLNIIDFLSEKY